MSAKPKVSPRDKNAIARKNKSAEKALSTEADSSHQSSDKLTKSQTRQALVKQQRDDNKKEKEVLI